MANVLLIGATGFVGSAVLNELVSRGHKVTAVARNPTLPFAPRFLRCISNLTMAVCVTVYYRFCLS